MAKKRQKVAGTGPVNLPMAELLGLPPDTTADDVKAAFRAKCEAQAAATRVAMGEFL